MTGELKDPLTQLSWDFDGTGAAAAQGEKAKHSFKLDKVFTVSLMVQDKAGRRRLVSAEVPVGRAVVSDLTMDEFEADLFGRWNGAYPLLASARGKRVPDVFFGPGAHYDVVRNGKTIAARARFQPSLPRAGLYQVCLGFRPAKNQATNVPVTIRHAGGVARLTVDQRTEGAPFPFVALGKFRFRAGRAASSRCATPGPMGALPSTAFAGSGWGSEPDRLPCPRRTSPGRTVSTTIIRTGNGSGGPPSRACGWGCPTPVRRCFASSTAAESAMLDTLFIRDNLQAVKDNCANRGVTADIDRVVVLDDERRRLISETQVLQQRQNEVSKLTSREKDAAAKQQLIAEGKSLRERVTGMEQQLKQVEEDLRVVLPEHSEHDPSRRPRREDG